MLLGCALVFLGKVACLSVAYFFLLLLVQFMRHLQLLQLRLQLEAERALHDLRLLIMLLLDAPQVELELLFALFKFLA